MFLRYIKAQVMVLLCGGLVGPIFLAVYFAIGQEPILKWMFYVGLLITALDILIALALANFSAKSAAKTQALEESGVLALAQITGIGETGTRINEQPVVKLQLHIEGPGIAPFDSQDRVIANVTRMGNFNNRKLVVLVDPTTQEYEILQILKANGIGMNNMIDLRSNPAARQQVQAIVRRAAAQQAPAGYAPAPAPGAPPPPPPPPSPAQFAARQPPPPAQFAAPPTEVSISARLQELETLRATGAVSDEEYTAKRAQILSDL
jgi:hypothetical protein